MKDIDIAWAAGLFEGEGCICGRSMPSAQGGIRWTLSLRLTDEDVIKRFQSIVGGNLNGPYTGSWATKPFWEWNTAAKPLVTTLLKAMLPYFGSRRTAKAQEALDGIAAQKGYERRKAA